MERAIAIVLAGLMISASILLTHHWMIVAPQAGSRGIVRLDRWTGTITVCAASEISAKGNDMTGVELDCSPP
jgi:hypothetical protein